ncbi:type I-F CRISPR-associated endoribonuclease Cas6/Csy4 [Kerstersia similis]|uniref:type I-F CRISPR-associated endoribonuclease Cas6/Csy4 n=1 Tax=Kerstersia similis TaxID=206505 RepID=UPI0039F09EB6
MTSHYVDIHLLPDPEFSQTQLMSALYAKLHRVLVQLGSHDIGVSFPGYSLKPKALGVVMRLHGTEPSLKALQAKDWLRGMRDHMEHSAVLPVPQQVQYRNIWRRQFKTNADRLRRRRMQRKGETFEQAVMAIPESIERQPDLPFIQIRSGSTGQSFPIFLLMGEMQDEARSGSFNSYGLSQVATIPWF